MLGEHDLSKYCLQDEDSTGTVGRGVQPAPTSPGYDRSGGGGGGVESGVWGHVWAETEDRGSEATIMRGKGATSDGEREIHPLVGRQGERSKERGRGGNKEGLEHADIGNGRVVPVGCDDRLGSVRRGSISGWNAPPAAAAAANAGQKGGKSMEYDGGFCRTDAHASSTLHQFSTTRCTRGGSASRGERISDTNNNGGSNNDWGRESPSNTQRTDRHGGPDVRRAATTKGNCVAGERGLDVDTASPRAVARTSDNNGKREASSGASLWNGTEANNLFRASTVFFPETDFASRGDVDRSATSNFGDGRSVGRADDSPDPSLPLFAKVLPTGRCSENDHHGSDVVGKGWQQLGGEEEGGAFVGTVASGTTAVTQSARWKQGQPPVEGNFLEKFPPGDRDGGNGERLSGPTEAGTRVRIDEATPTRLGDRSVSTAVESDTLGYFQRQQRQQEQQQQQGYRRVVGDPAPPMTLVGELEMTSPPRVVDGGSTSFPTGPQRRSRLSPTSPCVSGKHDKHSRPPIPTLPHPSAGVEIGSVGNREEGCSSDRGNRGSSCWKGSEHHLPARQGIHVSNAQEEFECDDARVANDLDQSHCEARGTEDAVVAKVQRNGLHRYVGGVGGLDVFPDGSMVPRVDRTGSATFLDALAASSSLAEGKGCTNNEVGFGRAERSLLDR